MPWKGSRSTKPLFAKPHFRACWEIPSKRQVGWPALAGEEIWSVSCNGRPSPSTLGLRRQQEMSGSEKDRLAALVNRATLRFRTGARREPEAVSDARVQVLRCGGTTYADVTREDEMLHRGVVSAVHGLVSIRGANARECRARSCGKATDWNLCCSVATTRTSTATSLPASNSARLHFSGRYRVYRWQEADLPEPWSVAWLIIRPNAGYIWSRRT